MNTLIIYDSVFGNTEKIARGMGEALAALGTARVVKVDEATAEQLAGVELVLVGSPTRRFRPTPAMAAFLSGLPAGRLKGIKAAAFDTRIVVADMNSRFLSVMVRLFGYAAAPLAKRLAQKGATLVMPPEGFYVAASEGPLKDGELERAAEWARRAAQG